MKLFFWRGDPRVEALFSAFCWYVTAMNGYLAVTQTRASFERTAAAQAARLTCEATGGLYEGGLDGRGVCHR